MMTRLITIGLLLLALAVPAYPQDTGSTPDVATLRVRAIQGGQAVLENVKTREASTVKTGDQVGGWTVLAITPLIVELEREGDRGRKIRAQLPVPQPVPSPPSHP